MEKEQNGTAGGDEQEKLRRLEASLEMQIDQMDFSEFDDDEEDWNLFEKKDDKEKKTQKKTVREKGKSMKPSASLKEDPAAVSAGEDVSEEDSSAVSDEEEEAFGEDPSAVPNDEETFGEDPEEDFLYGIPDPEVFEEPSPDEETDDDLDDAEYIQSAAYKRKARRTLTYEQREERRARRIEAFWDFVDRNVRQIRWVLVGLAVIAAAITAGGISSRWVYHSVKDLIVSEKEDTLSVSYANISGKVLKYGVDGAMLVDHNNNMLWTISYAMNDPELGLWGSTFVIYDKKGTSICVCNESGQIGNLSTDMPIVKAKVSKQGVVAAILEDGQNAWIRTYTYEGGEIATLKTTFANPGYPMDLGLSEDGTILAVSYLYMDNGTPVSRVSFYNFGTVGQNQRDNLVTETEYRDAILPEIDYIDGRKCIAFREDGFSVFSGGQIPSEAVKVTVDQSIVSTFHDSEYVGLILQNRNSENDYLICLYNMNGKEVLKKETDFHFQNVEMNEGQIVLSANDEFCIYSLQGVEKYRGSLEIPARVFTGFGRNKFIYVTEDLFRIIQVG